MSVLNRDFSGFFPFWTVPYSRLPSGWGYETPPAALTQCHWLAKSATLTMALAYNNSYGPDAGTVTGTATISDAPSGSNLMALPPAQRAAYAGTARNASGLISNPPATPFTCAGTFGSGIHSTPYTQDVSGLSMAWFAGMPLSDTLSPQGPVAYDPSSGKWYTDCGFGMGIGVTAGRYDVEVGADPSSTAVFYLKLSGTTFATIPINAAYSPADFGSTTLSGSMSLDFDTFWTP